MSAANSDEIVQALERLAAVLQSQIQAAQSAGTLDTRADLYLRQKLTEFEYGEQGVTKRQASVEIVRKPTFYWAARGVADSLKQFNEYRMAAQVLSEFAPTQRPASGDLDGLLERLAHTTLSDGPIDAARLQRMIEAFLAFLRSEPVSAGAEVALDGIIILAPPFELTAGSTRTALRATRRDDFEKDLPYFAPYGWPIEVPSAVMSLDCPARWPVDVQNEIERAIAALRLFRAGSIKSCSISLRSESPIGFGGILRPGHGDNAQEKYAVREEDVGRLKDFFERLLPHISQDFYDPFGDVSSFALAYQRYSDAIMRNGIVERRIANAVMGLEGLLLRDTETQGLAFRLSVRAAKLLGAVGYGPLEVRDALQKCYAVRSTFVHGGQVRSIERRKIDRRYGGLPALLSRAVDYVRAVIVAMLLLREEKEKIISLIDDSLVDSRKSAELESKSAELKQFIRGD